MTGRRPRANSLPVHVADKTPHTSPHHHHHHRLRDRSNSVHQRKTHSKADLWKGSVSQDLGDGVVVQMVGMDSYNHAIYTRVDPACPATPATLATVPVGKVVEVTAEEGRRRAARAALAGGRAAGACPRDACPGADELLRLGAVWLVNETTYAATGKAHAKRLAPADAARTPDWKDMTVRVHVSPDRFFPAHEVDWGKYCRGLLLDRASAEVGGKPAHVPVAGFPDKKDGVIVYEVSPDSSDLLLPAGLIIRFRVSQVLKVLFGFSRDLEWSQSA